MVTSLPAGMPCAQAAVVAFPSAMFTSVMISATLTAPLPVQSPTNMSARVGVALSVR